MIRLDVAICTYNRAADLDRCLETLSRQSASQGWRITVIDNNSTDATPEVVSRHAASGLLPDLTRIFEPTPGLTAARQRAVAESAADWVAFVDDDCLLHPNWIETAMATLNGHPDAGALGGRVVPDWGRPAPAYLDRNGWLFARQDHGDRLCEVESLVGAGLILSRRALERIGWTSQPLLADRIGPGFVSGGDVEISLRLQAGGYALLYQPAMQLDHVIASNRQTMPQLIGLAAGLGGGATLASLLVAEDFGAWIERQADETREALRRHRRSLGYVLRRQYDWNEWRIFYAFETGRRRQFKVVVADPDAFTKLVGVCRPSGTIGEA